MIDPSFFMRRALELAEKGRGFTHPNPLVGAVLVRDDGIIGEGWHTAFGAPHAEIEALRDAKRRGLDPRGASLFVTLEPCCHHGKTPPCTEAIIAAGIAEVFAAIEDPNPEVRGQGSARLKDAGMTVATGLLEEEARRLNKAYLHFRSTGRPYVIWKAARTADGRLTFHDGIRSLLSGPESRAVVESWRARTDAVAVGVRTAIIDNPSLRAGKDAERHPRRIVFDSNLSLPLSSRLVAENADRLTVIITANPLEERRKEYVDRGVELILVPKFGDHIDLALAMKALASKGILEIYLESGDKLGRAAVAAGLVSELHLFQTGAIGPESRGRIVSMERMGEDAFLVMELES